jgi:hypothetical protein
VEGVTAGRGSVKSCGSVVGWTSCAGIATVVAVIVGGAGSVISVAAAITVVQGAITDAAIAAPTVIAVAVAVPGSATVVAAIPGPCADEKSARKPARSVIAVWSASVGIIRVITVSASWGTVPVVAVIADRGNHWANSDADCDLRMRSKGSGNGEKTEQYK